MQDIVGRTVIARTKDGPIQGKVKEVMNREEAQQRLRPGSKGKWLRSGNYLTVVGVGYPVRRSRCKLVSKPKRGRKPKRDARLAR